MNLKKSAKIGAVAIAIAAPLAIGWAATAGASSVEGLFDFHTHDQYVIDGYTYERENIGGVVTNIIIDPDGNVVSADEAPAEIAEMVENWVEPESEIQLVIAEDGGSACYITDDDLINDAEPGEGWDAVIEEDGLVAAARWTDGDLEVQYFGEASNLDEIESGVLDGTPLADIPGAQEMSAC